ncbi:hypothetical protein [Haloarcula sediminis]|uniref:hypothetical protein n=1 Tax=Haloarcula sediminis TaxID=3111777 RepID=UPI002D77C0F9|nr:hypothetical protein [Haloarcula sp. CK38]
MEVITGSLRQRMSRAFVETLLYRRLVVAVTVGVAFFHRRDTQYRSRRERQQGRYVLQRRPPVSSTLIGRDERR